MGDGLIKWRDVYLYRVTITPNNGVTGDICYWKQALVNTLTWEIKLRQKVKNFAKMHWIQYSMKIMINLD